MTRNIVKFQSLCGKHQFASCFYEESMMNPLGVVGLNPSITKDGKNSTVSALSKIAKREGFDSLFITNLYSYITPDPKLLKELDEPVLDENDSYIESMMTTCKKVLCIWGNNAEEYRIVDVLPIIKHKAYSIGFTKSGQPRHVLHTKIDVPLVRL